MAIDKTNTRKLKTTVGPTDRKSAKLEAEKGETVLTNLSNTDNIYELKLIGGKKHSAGGTPLNLPTGDNPGEGSSFIFSDNKKLALGKKDLELFGIKSNKSMTPAELTRQHLDVIAKSKAIIKDKYEDKISKKAAEKNLDNSRFLLSKVALWQESKKGMADGHSDTFNAFFDKTKTSPEDLFSVNEKQEQETTQAMQSAFGGAVKQFAGGGDPQLQHEDEYRFQYAPEYMDNGGTSRYRLTHFADGGTTNGLPEYKGSDDDLKKYFNGNKELAAQYQYIESLKDNDAFKKAMYEEYKTAWDKDIHGKGYGALKEKGKWKQSATPEEVVNNFIDMQKRNLAMKAHGIDYNKIGQTASDGKNSSKYTSEFLKSKGLDKDLVIPGMDKTAQEQAAYIAFNELTKNQDKHRDNKELEGVLSPFSAPKLGLSDENPFGVKGSSLSRADGVYTNTTSGQIAGFNPPKVIDAKPEKDNTYDPGKDPAHLNPEQQPGNPYGFRREDSAGLMRALAAKNEILKLSPWAKSPSTNLTEATYYSPEREIAATNEQLNQGIQGVTAFGTPGAAAAAISEMQGNAYAQVANTVGSYADKNVGLFNNVAERNTELANARNAQDAQLQTNMYDKNTVLKQQFQNSLSAAKDKILQMSNAAWTNASNIYNLNSTTENFKKDPFTGLITKYNDRALKPTDDANKTFGKEFNEFSAPMLAKGISPDLVMKAYLTTKGGKFNITQDDGIKTANELDS